MDEKYWIKFFTKITGISFDFSPVLFKNIFSVTKVSLVMVGIVFFAPREYNDDLVEICDYIQSLKTVDAFFCTYSLPVVVMI